MRIVITAGIYPPDIGGPAKHAELFRDFLSRNGGHGSVITYGTQRHPAIKSVSRVWPFGIRQFIYFLKCLGAALFNDAFYAQDLTSAGLPTLLAAVILRRKFVVRVGGDILWERLAESGKADFSLLNYYAQRRPALDAPVLYLVSLLVLRLADAVIVPAELLRKVYTDFYNVNPEKIFTIPNPIIELEVNPNIQADPNTFLFAGRFVRYKNLDILMKVFDKVRQKNSQGKLVLIGDGPERSRLDNLRNQLVSKNFIEIKRSMPREKLAEEINRAGVCVGPALTEFNPNFILECLSAKKPVLLSRENGLSVPLSDEFLFDPRDSQELEEKMFVFLKKPKIPKLTIPKINPFEKIADIFHSLHL